jgi:hypothetical protein
MKLLPTNSEKRAGAVKVTKFHCVVRAAAFAAALSFPAGVRGAGLLYELLPGSTITPWSGGHPSGPSEALTGTFTWQLTATYPDGHEAWAETSLSFQSASFSLTLDPANALGSWTMPLTNGAYFGAAVDCPALSFGALEISEQVYSSVTGPAASPTTLTCPLLDVTGLSGGADLAQITFEAQLVPEPQAAPLVLTGLAVLGGARIARWRRKRL